MTVTVANTANTNTFDYWRNRTNELAYAMSTYAVTAGGTDKAVGDAAIDGAFSANTVVLGNSSVNVAIATSNSVQQSNGQYFLNANGAWSVVSAPTYVDVVNTSTTSATVIDYYSFSAYNAVEYMVFVKDNNANNSLFTKIATMSTNTGGVYYTEYATMLSNSAMGAFVANANATHTKLNFTPTSSNTTVKFLRYNI